MYVNVPRKFREIASSLPKEVIQNLRQVPGWVQFYIQLYQHVQTYHTLPWGGGLMNQSLRCMNILDIINDEMTIIHDQEQMEREAMREARRRLHGG